MTRTPVSERFWPKVDKNGPVPAHDPDLGPCWIWTAAKNPAGYGHINVNGRNRTAHRVAWELLVGEIPPAMDLLHKCDVKACVRSSHHYLGTDSDNQRDMHARSTAPRNMPKGEQHPNSKLTAEAVREIRARAQAGERQWEIAAAFGICQSHVSTLVRRKQWGTV